MNGEKILLGTNADWINYKLGNDVSGSNKLERHPSLYSSARLLWSNWEHDAQFNTNVLQPMQQRYSVGTGANLMYKDQDSIEIFAFAFDHSISTFNCNMNFCANIDIYEKFTHYFRAQANALIKKALKRPFTDPYSLNKQTDNWCTGILSNEKRKSIISEIATNRYYLTGPYNNIYLTKRELQCIAFFLHGYSAKQIAKILKISAGTIYEYSNNVKYKLGCRKVYEVFDILRQQPGFLNLLSSDFLIGI